MHYYYWSVWQGLHLELNQVPHLLGLPLLVNANFLIICKNNSITVEKRENDRHNGRKREKVKLRPNTEAPFLSTYRPLPSVSTASSWPREPHGWHNFTKHIQHSFLLFHKKLKMTSPQGFWLPVFTTNRNTYLQSNVKVLEPHEATMVQSRGKPRGGSKVAYA